ncbi:MAG: flippase-like domain-containing protein [Candidatus Brocadiae bacterium]|nr:flippase-like domain-containing protein [Candidatus Brocadiia bacterium]
MPRRRTIIIALAKVLAVLIVLALLYYVLRRIGFGTIHAAMRRVRPGSVGAAALLYFGVFLLWSFRWQLLMKREQRKSILALFPIYMAGVFGNVITPGARVGGEGIRAYYMSRAFGGEKTAYLGTILADKLGNGAVFMVFMVLSVAFVVLFVPLGLVPKLVLEGVVLLVVTIVVGGFLVRKRMAGRSGVLRKLLRAVYNSALLKLVRRFRTYEHFEDYAIRKLDNVFTPIAQAAGSPKALVKILVISAGSWMLLYLAHYVLFRGLGVEIGFPQVLVIVTISTFVGDVSVSPGGAGFMETAMIGLCAAFGVEHGTAAAVTLISRGIFYAYGLGVGGLCLGALAAVYGRGAE